MKLIDRIDQLYDFLADHPTVTRDQIAKHMDVSYARAGKVIHALRIFLGDTKDISLVCDPNPNDRNGPWLYSLIGTLEGARPWQTNQMRHLVTRIETSNAIADSLIAATDGRTVDGRKVRKIHRVLSRLLEDLEELSEQPPIPADQS
jgi:hypothetical protein